MKNELTYWYTLTFLRGITLRRKNEIFVNCYKLGYSVINLFDDSTIWDEIGLSEAEKVILSSAQAELTRNAFAVEKYLSQGYEIIPFCSKEYPEPLKKNLKLLSPTIIFIKGNKELLATDAIAIVGSRNADDVSLSFTSNVAHNCAAMGKTVVSGFAKGVDRMALDAALEAGGKSIIVLPQGIATFSSGFRQYYQAILQGRVLVLSTFHPEMPWRVENAMERNTYVYGLAQSIYVARSDSKGGTWEGVQSGMKRGCKIYVRKADSSEKCANNILIQQGAKAVDQYGIELSEVNAAVQQQSMDLDDRIKDVLTSGALSSKSVIASLHLDWTDANMKKHLRSLSFVEEYKNKSGTIMFQCKGVGNPSLFD